MIKLPKADAGANLPASDMPPLHVPPSGLDSAAQELLAPIAPTPSPAFAPRTAPASSEDAYQRALRDGTIPTFSDQPADVASDANAPPLDIEAERQAWEALIAFIGEHKDEGTVVTIADPDSFMRNIV